MARGAEPEGRGEAGGPPGPPRPPGERPPAALNGLELEPAPPERPLGRPLPPRVWPWRLRQPAPPPEVAALRRFSAAVAVSVLFHALFVLAAFLLLRGGGERPPVEVMVHFTMGARPVAEEDPEARAAGETTPAGRVETADEADAALAAGTGGGLLSETDRQDTSVGVGHLPAGSVFEGRLGGRRRLLAEGGGDSATEGALALALDWLARHQETDGTWNARTYVRGCGDTPCPGPGRKAYVEGTTALALLPFLGAGHTHRDGPWKDTVRGGLRALLARQRPDGSFGQDTRGYESALATLAIAEAYGLTGARVLRAPLDRAVALWVRTQGRAGGWRYEPGDGEADSSVTGWAALALVAAAHAGVPVRAETLDGCRSWFREHTEADGSVYYLGRGVASPALLGVGVFVPVMLGARPDADRLVPVVRRLEATPPRWPDDGTATSYRFGADDPIHWYYGAAAAFQCGGGTWKLWHERLRPLLLDHQTRAGHAAGSWAPTGETGAQAGRVVATALGALCLEVYYRDPRAVSVR